MFNGNWIIVKVELISGIGSWQLGKIEKVFYLFFEFLE